MTTLQNEMLFQTYGACQWEEGMTGTWSDLGAHSISQDTFVEDLMLYWTHGQSQAQGRLSPGAFGIFLACLYLWQP